MQFYARFAALTMSLFLLATACRQEQKQIPVKPAGPTYFSVQQFILDQFDLFRDQPFVFIKVASMGSSADTSFAAADTMDWASVLQPFANADISDTAMLGKYRYSEFDEPLTQQHILLYEARQPELSTRKLMIAADQETGRIYSIYMDVNLPGGATERLFYAPLKLIQIQRFSVHNGRPQNLRVEYFFPGRENAGSEEEMYP